MLRQCYPLRFFPILGLWLVQLVVGSGLLAQDSNHPSTRATGFDATPRIDAIPRQEFFAIEALDSETQELSQQLLLKALDSEAFYTLVGQLKPVSEGFWGSYFALDPLDTSELERIRAALQPWNVPDLFYADVLVYESTLRGQRYASAYVAHVPSLKKLLEQHADFFGQWGLTADSSPGEIMLTVEKSRSPADRWRGFGLLFGYPEYAVDFFVEAGLHQRTTGEFVERDFRQIPTFASRSGRFVYAVPKLSRSGPDDLALERRATLLLSEYQRLRPTYTGTGSNPVELLRDWMDDGSGSCHPQHLLDKLPAKTDAELDAEIAEQKKRDLPPPSVAFNHLYVVIDEADFVAIRDSVAVTQSLAASDQGFPTYLPVDGEANSIYLRGRDTYLEIFGPNNKFNEPVGKMGLGWSVDQTGELDRVEQLLGGDINDLFTRVLNRWDFDRESPVDWYHAVYRSKFPSPDMVWWFSECHPDFMRMLDPQTSSEQTRVTRKDFLAARYDSSRWLKNFNRLTLEMPTETARVLRADLEKVGWRTEEFDSRTWIVSGPEFRLMLLMPPTTETPRIHSIGFITNEAAGQSVSEKIGTALELQLDGQGSGWLLFQHE